MVTAHALQRYHARLPFSFWPGRLGCIFPGLKRQFPALWRGLRECFNDKPCPPQQQRALQSFSAQKILGFVAGLWLGLEALYHHP